MSWWCMFDFCVQIQKHSETGEELHLKKCKLERGGGEAEQEQSDK